jgi:hypothetical protein
MHFITGILAASLLASTSQAEDSVLAAAAREATRPLAISADGLSGTGGDWLNAQADLAHLVGFGEQHATADIALFAQAWFSDLDAQGYDHAVIEVGPWSTRAAEALLRGAPGEFEADVAARADGLAYPFLFFQEEADFARDVVARHEMPGPALFGVDQEFIAGGTILAERLALLAQTAEQRDAVHAFSAALAENAWLVGAADGEVFDELSTAFAGGPAEARDLVAEMQRSNRIYAPFTGRGGSGLLANTEREEGMRSYFLDAWATIAASRSNTPRVFFKFGGNHLMRGHTNTHVPGFGGFLAEWGFARGLGFFNVMVDCDGGLMTDPRSGEASACESYFPLEGSPFEGLAADGPVVIDLVGLRSTAARDEALDPRILRLILAFDAYVLLPDVAPATLITGRSE